MLWGSPYISWHLNFDPWDTIWALICTICLLINTFFVLKRAAEPNRPPSPKPYVSLMLLDTSPALPPWPHLFYHCMCNTCMYLSLWTQNKFAIKTYVHCHCHLSSSLLTWFHGMVLYYFPWEWSSVTAEVAARVDNFTLATDKQMVFQS